MSGSGRLTRLHKITHVPHGLHTYVHCASITGQPVKAVHSNVQWTSSPSWSPIASLSTLTYKRCVGGSLYACSVFTLHWRMGLYQRHIGMTGIMNSLALASHTVHWPASNPFFNAQNQTISLSLSNARTHCPTCTHFSHCSSTSVCVCGGAGGDGKGALHVG